MTHDVSTFPPLLREFDERGEDHAGAIVLVGIRSRDFAIACAAAEVCLEQVPGQGRWRNRAVFASAPLPS